MVEQGAAPAGVLATHSTHPGGAGAPPGGQYGSPARAWLTDGRAYVRGQRKARPAPEGKRCDGAPGGARALEREYGTDRTMVAPPGAPSPLIVEGTRKTGLPGASANNTGDGACALAIPNPTRGYAKPSPSFTYRIS